MFPELSRSSSNGEKIAATKELESSEDLVETRHMFIGNKHLVTTAAIENDVIRLHILL